MTAPHSGRSARSGVLTDLALGVRMSVSGGRSGWLRLALIAVGVGVGVGLLLLVASLPTALDGRQTRTEARTPVAVETGPTDGTLLTDDVRSGFRDIGIEGRLLQPEGPDAPVPPGLDRLPAPGEVVLSPALERRMASPDGEALRGRWGDRVVGTIGPEGLAGPGELTFYLGTDELTEETATRISAFGRAAASGGTDPVLVVLSMVGVAVLLVPVMSFVGTAVRFGSEARDRRLAALRLVGADAATTRRVAAGETLVGSLAGLAVGAGLLLVAQQVLPPLLPASLSIRGADLTPVPLLAVIIVLAVPVASVLVSQSAMRRVVVEPLGVVRRASVTRRRLWWRLALLVLGALALVPLFQRGAESSPVVQALVAVGVVLVLLAVAALVPWVVDVVVRRLGGGGVAWELAVRRLQGESGTAVRSVSAIVVSVAGLVAIHGLVAGFSGLLEENQEPRTAVFQAMLLQDGGVGAAPDEWLEALAGTEGVRDVDVLSATDAHLRGTDEPVRLDVGSCAVLASEVGVSECADGDVFVVAPQGAPVPEAGTAFVLGEPGSGASTWALPADATTVTPDVDVPGGGVGLPAWVFATPSALDGARYDVGWWTVYLSLDPAVPDAVDHVRTTAAQVQPTTYVASLEQESLAGALGTVRQVLLVGTVLLLVVVGASLLVTVGEQLRERRRPLAVLVAFGARRRTLGLSVLWQVAIPMALGLVLAVGTGVTLALALQGALGVAVGVDWGGVAATAGGAAAVVLLTTAASLPLLTGLTRPAALHAE